MKFDTTVPTPSRNSPERGAYRLLVVHSPVADQIGRSIALGQQPLEIGRATAPVALDDDQLSRVHCRFEAREGGHTLFDLESRNGTFVGGARVDQCDLTAEMVIRVGAHVLVYQYLPMQAIEAMADAAHKVSPIVGDSWPTILLRNTIAERAPTSVPVLVLGESGVGKELVAAELHRQSGRSGRFVPVNCAALPDHLAESELFGHVKGAFTGAHQASSGLFGAATRGTLFLDEIGDLALPLQAKMLRALNDGEIRRVGDPHPTHVETRIVAATNVDLEAAIEAGTFRGDLYARLMGATIAVPSLRERRQDILPLARRFLEAQSSDAPIEPDAAEALTIYDWPYNVRELQNLARGVATTVRSKALFELSSMPKPIRERLKDRESDGEAPQAASEEVPLILRVPRDREPSAAELTLVLDHFGGNVAQVAHYFGRARKQIYRWARKQNLDVDSFRADLK